MKPSLGIVVVNWNSFEVTANCLESLRAIEYDNYETIVVDNGSEDGSGEKLEHAFPEITLLKNPDNLGFTGGNNTGIRYALDQNKALIMLLNNDTVVTPGFAAVLADTLKAYPEAGAVQPKIMYNRERYRIWNAGSAYSRTWALTRTRGVNELDSGQYDFPGEIPWITGCCFMVRADVVRQIGLLDQRFFIYYEDTDWSFKIRARGFALRYQPEASIYHEAGMANKNRAGHGEGTLSPFSHYVNVRNHLFIVRRYTRGACMLTAWLYQWYKITGYTLYFLWKRRPKKLIASWRGFRDGVVTSLK